MKPAVLVFLFFLFIGRSSPDLSAQAGISFADAARMAVESCAELRYEYAARALREEAWRWGIRAYLPRISISASEDDRLSQTGSDSFLKNYSLNADQLLWDGGRLSLSRRMEKTELDLAGNRLTRMEADYGEAAVSGYRELLLGRNILEINRKTGDFLDEQRRLLQKEVELGLARPMDLREAEISAALAELQTFSLEMDLEEAEWKLADKLGLETLPVLSERIDTQRSPVLPGAAAAKAIAEARNQELAAFRFSITKREAELKAASLSWIPSLRLTGSFALSGRDYPLSRHSWTVGLVIDFSSPWLSGNFAANAGWDPPYDRNARLQQTALPAPDPGAVFSVRAAELALSSEKSKYQAALKELHSAAERGIKNCSLLDRKRQLAMEALELETERFRLAELKLSLGEINRIDLMELRLDYAKREAALVEAAAALLEAERQLERLLDLKPGGLSAFMEPSI